MLFTRSVFRTLLAATVASAVGVALPSEARACGGFFCSRSPVDQTAEHIVFTVNDDHTVTAYVQIQYAGDKDDFAWIVPAPGIPKLNTDFPDLAMRALDAATAPQYMKNGCNRAFFDGAGGSASVGPVPAAQPGVTVLATQAVGPFDTVTLEGTSADVIVQWLDANGYRITDKMIPFIQPYVEAGMHFVAMKLQADKSVTDIQPLGMTYDGDKPMIPIRLTAVAAQPEMAIVTFILSNRRWAPENYIDLAIPDSLIEFDNYGNQNNYLRVVSSESDKVGGQAFVTEYAKATTDLVQQIQSQSQFANPNNPDAVKSQSALLGVLQKFPYITRLYGRMSAEEMTDDPIFMVSTKTFDVSNVHDLTDPNLDYSTCPSTTPPGPPPCTFAYCGRRGACVDVEAPLPYAPDQTGPAAACVCANDATARLTTTGTSGLAAVYCEPARLDLDAPAGANGGPLLSSTACEAVDCGAHGACVPMNGNPTCQCEGGYGAVVTTNYDPSGGGPKTSVTCQQVPGPAPSPPVLPPVGQTKIPDPSNAGTGAGGAPSGTPSNLPSGGANARGGGCSASRGAPKNPMTTAILGIAAAGLVVRRRRFGKPGGSARC